MGCEDPPAPKKEQPTTASLRPEQSPKPAEPETPSVPSLAIDDIGPKVGFTRAILKDRAGREALAAELAKHRAHFEGKEVPLAIDRKVPPEWVSVYFAELAKIGVSQVLVRTQTRSEFPGELRFTPESKLPPQPACSVVAMILEDRGTAVWKLGGGVAGKRPKGMAGPDLTMTGDTIERNAKACKNGNALFVAGAPGIEWGLIYDLAASTYTLAGARFDTRVLLTETPVPGHKVSLQR